MVRYLRVGGVESTFGVFTVAPASMTPCRAKSVGLTVDRQPLLEENIESYIYANAYGGALKISGTIEGNMRPNSMAVFLHSIMGVSAECTKDSAISLNGLTDTAPLTGVVYGLAFPLPMDFCAGEQTIQDGNHQVEYQFCGVGLKNMKMNFANKELVTVSYDYFAKNMYVHKGTYNMPSAAEWADVAEDPITFYTATLWFNGSAATAHIKSCDMTIDRKSDEDRFILGSFTLAEVGITGMTEIGGTMTFTEQEYDQIFVAMMGVDGATAIGTSNPLGTISPLEFRCTNLAGTLRMVVHIGTAVFSDADSTMQGQTPIDKKVTWKATGQDILIYVAPVESGH